MIILMRVFSLWRGMIFGTIMLVGFPSVVSAGVCHFYCQGAFIGSGHSGTPASQAGDSNVSCSRENVATACAAAGCNDFCRTKNTTEATYVCAPTPTASCNDAPAPSAGSSSPTVSTTPAPTSAPPSPAFPVALGVSFGSVDRVNGLNEYIAAGYAYGLRIVLVMAMVMVVYGGFRYLVGSALEDVKRGKEIIVDAIVGLMIALGAYFILATINPNTLRLSLPRISAVTQEPASTIAPSSSTPSSPAPTTP